MDSGISEPARFRAARLMDPLRRLPQRPTISRVLTVFSFFDVQKWFAGDYGVRPSRGEAIFAQTTFPSGGRIARPGRQALNERLTCPPMQ
jgi:hypothetical protein